jgi:predicted phage terminase large subunit-like protein
VREPTTAEWIKNFYEPTAKIVRATKTSHGESSLEEWKEYGYTDPEKWIIDYKRSQTDLHWFCTDVFNLALVDCHKVITRDFFIKKNPYLTGTANWKDDIANQSEIKNRLLLYPRSTFKSSIDKIDIIQWIVCFPNIRVTVMTAEEDLSYAFVDDIKKFFVLSDDEKLTRFQMLFLAHCWPEKGKRAMGESGKFLSRARTEDQVQPTILGLSIGKSTSGIHSDVGKFDDCISDDNSGPKSSEDGRLKTGERLRLSRPIVDPYGYRDYIGTPYNEDDGYQALIDKLPGLKVFKEAAWKIKKHAGGKALDDLVEDDVELLFPKDANGVDRLTFKFLIGEYKNDPYIFACQYLIDPARTRLARFTEDLMDSHVCPAEGLPQQHTDFAVFDLAYSEEDKRDYTVGVVGWVDEEQARGYIVKMIRGRYSKSELPFQIANLAAKWRVAKLAIENSPGAQFLENDIRRELTRLGYSECPIEWVKVDTQKGAKNARAEGVENLLMQNRLYFSADIGEVFEQIKKEFVRFKPGSRRKDDIVDAVGHFCRFIPANPELTATTKTLLDRAWAFAAQKNEHDRIFNVPDPIQIFDPPPMPMEIGGIPVGCPYCGFRPCICVPVT